MQDENCVAPYIEDGIQWFGYDDVYSIGVKSQWAMDMGLGGGMVWSIDTDDFHGLCEEGTFPLVREINRVMNGGAQTVPPGYTTPTQGAPSTGPPPTGPTPAPNELCNGQPGYHADPENCSKTPCIIT